MKRAALLVLGLVVGVAGCDMIPSTSEPDSITDVEITPSLVRFDALGASTSFEALVLTESGVVVEGADVSWSSSNPSVATVNSAGTVTAVANGQTRIEATAEGITSEATVVVEQVVHTVTIVADSMRLNYLGATGTVQAQARDSRGNAVPGAALTWHSTAPDTVSVSASGQLTAVRVGTALVVATAPNGEADTIRVRVRQVAAAVTVQPSQDTIEVGQTTQLSAVVRDSGNVIVSGAPVSWSSSASGTASVSSAGLVTGVAAGTATITATSGAATGTSSILVQLTSSSMSIATARTQPAGTVVTVVGVVTAAPGTYNAGSFYVQDATGGIQVFTTSPPAIVEGDSLQVTGTIGTFNEETQISGTVTVTDLGTGTLPTPAEVTSTTVNAGERQGELVVVRNALVDSVQSATNYAVWLSDSEGSFVVFVDGDVGIAETSWQVGARYDVTGIMARFHALFEIKPRRLSDVVQVAAADPCTAWNSQSIAIGQTQTGTLLATDCAPGDGYYYEGYRFTVSATTNVTITLTSAEFDAYLIVTNTTNSDPANTSNWLYWDDDSGGGTDSQLSGSIPAGDYILWVSTFSAGETGSYSLSVQ